ncbi:MAG: hypothetical protein JW999_09130 [Methanotrichaceae archaeon]|nr:hypothetical protein [Methanotrichaceae archaeon]
MFYYFTRFTDVSIDPNKARFPGRILSSRTWERYILSRSSSFEIGDCSGASVWVRNLQFTEVTVEVPFTYQEPNGTTKEGTAIIPGGSPAGATVKTMLDSEFPNAVKIIGSAYAGILSFDIFMGKGIYPRLWVAPELQAVDIALEVMLTDTPEVDLLKNIQASLEAKLASYKIGEDLEYADLAKYIYVDYATGRAFSGIDDVISFSLTCRSSNITGFGQKVILDDDERIEPGTVSVTEAILNSS